MAANDREFWGRMGQMEVYLKQACDAYERRDYNACATNHGE